MKSLAEVGELEQMTLETAMTERVDNKLSRRKVFAGVGTAGALAVVAAAVPLVKPDLKPVVSADAQERRQGDGYQVTDHVRQYYQTARA